jgi:hypothetical protein
MNGTSKTPSRNSDRIGTHSDHVIKGVIKSNSWMYQKSFSCLVCRKEVLITYTGVQCHMANHVRYKKMTSEERHDIVGQIFKEHMKRIEEFKARDYNQR